MPNEPIIIASEIMHPMPMHVMSSETSTVYLLHHKPMLKRIQANPYLLHAYNLWSPNVQKASFKIDTLKGSVSYSGLYLHPFELKSIKVTYFITIK